jgi:thioesterase domain-containing protein
VQPVGPYYLGGHSQGGVEALNVAQELSRRGERVALLVILDSIVSAAMLPATVATATAAPAAPGMPKRPRLSTLMRLPFRGIVQFKGVRQFEMFYYWGLVQLRFARRLTPWSGPTLVAVSELRRTTIESAWRYLCTGSLEVVAIPGDHNAMLRGPSATLLANYLTKALAEAG